MARASRSRGRPRSGNDAVVGYGVYLNGAQVGTQTPDQVRRWRDRQTFSYTVQGLACGTGYTVGVDAVDRGDRPLAGDHDDGLHLGLPRYDGALGADRDAPGRRDRELGGARLDSLVGQRRCGRVRALRLRCARLHRQRRQRDAYQPQVRHELPDRDRRGRRGRQPLRPGQLVLPHLRLPVDQQATVDPDPGPGREDHQTRAWRCRGRPRPTMSA